MRLKRIRSRPRRIQSRFNSAGALANDNLLSEKRLGGLGAMNLVSRAMSLRARQLQGPDISRRFGASIAFIERWNV